ncbi:MAG: hypothetical protein K0S33_1876 [Bacteroidetes bacterium]|jgi:hypothetical protein|nr:hypothetical protein [Bacteroidota bacterium]
MNNMKKLFLIILLLNTLIRIDSHAQEDSYVSGPSVLSPSPNASGLGRYAEFPVSLYTGIPGISLPIYTISAGELSVPISLSYHAKGVRVEDQASWVGLGWSLNAGGVVTRSVIGLPDDVQGSGYTTYGVCGGTLALHDGFLASGGTIHNLYNASFTPSDAGILYELAEGSVDGEPDKFFFNFNGMSGEFVFDKDGNPSLMSDQKLAITYTRDAATHRINSFKIVDQDGTIYSFNAIELTSYYINTDDGSAMGVALPIPYLQTTWNPDGRSYNSAWYLTKIENANKTQEINLTYVNENVKDVKDFSYDVKSWLSPSGGTQQMFSSREYFIEGKRLSSITWTGGSVDFIPDTDNPRLDIGTLAVSDNRTTTNYALKKITIKDYNSVAQKSYLLSYDYFTSIDFVPAFPAQENCLKKRLKLLSLTEESNTTGVTNPPHQFFYDETYTIPYKASPYTDYWGYSNLLPNTYGAGGPEIPKQYFYPNDVDPLTLSRYSLYQRTSYTAPEILIAGYDKTPNVTYMKAGSLTKVVFPTKGYTEFEYEANSFYFMGANRTGGGLRIKKTTTYDGIDHAKDMIKTYDYTLSADPLKSSGIVTYLPFFAKYEGLVSSVHRHNYYANSVCGLGTTQGGYVGYQEVTVNHNGNGKVWSKFNTQAAFGVVNEDLFSGTYIYSRTNAVGTYLLDGGMGLGAATKANDNFPYAPNPNYDWVRGSLLEEKVYNNSTQLVKRTVNEYTIKNRKNIHAVKNVRLAWACSGGATYPIAYLNKYAKYYIISGWNVLSKQTVEDYDPVVGTVLYSSDTWYNYDNANHMMLTSTKSYDSKNRELKTEYRRPHDYAVSTNFTNSLLLQHRFAPVLEELSWENDGSGYKLLGANFTTYGNFASANGLSNPQWLPNKSYSMETATPVPTASFTPTSVTTSTITLDSRYKQKGEFNYGTKDNLTRYSYLNAGNKNNSTYIWGYNKQYAIAKVSNATEAECGFSSFESDDQALWAMNSSIADADAHTGTGSRKLPAGSSVFGPGRDFLPTAAYRNEKFILSCWVKTTAAYANNAGSLALHTWNPGSPGAVYPAGVSAAYVATLISNTNNTWKYVEVEIDLKKIKVDGGLALTTDLQIGAFIWNTDPSNTILVDDIRFYPKEARMSSFTFAPLKGTTSMSDENSDAIFYEYDNFGRLKLVKDQFGRIVQKTEYNYKP